MPRFPPIQIQIHTQISYTPLLDNCANLQIKNCDEFYFVNRDFLPLHI